MKRETARQAELRAREYFVKAGIVVRGDGAVISEFSTRSTDETDVFTDGKIVRQTVFED